MIDIRSATYIVEAIGIGGRLVLQEVASNRVKLDALALGLGPGAGHDGRDGSQQSGQNGALHLGDVQLGAGCVGTGCPHATTGGRRVVFKQLQQARPIPCIAYPVIKLSSSPHASEVGSCSDSNGDSSLPSIVLGQDRAARSTGRCGQGLLHAYEANR